MSALVPPVVPLVAERLKEVEEPIVRVSLIRVLGRIRSPESLPPLVKALGDDDDRVRSAAIKAFVSRGETALDAVVKAASDGPARRQAAAARVLGQFGKEEHTLVVTRLLKSEETEVRFEAVRALGGPSEDPKP